MVFLQPLGVQRRYVPHLKGLISVKVDLEAQERDSTFTFFHAHLTKAILHLKEAKSTAVFTKNRTVAISRSKLGVFNWAWQRVKVLPHP